MVRLDDVATKIRSKNAGPFWQTLDVFFDGEAAYRHVLATGIVSQDLVGGLYKIPPGDVKIFEMNNINVIKISFPRRVTAGDFADRDLHAGQQHVPLAGVMIPAVATASSAT